MKKSFLLITGLFFGTTQQSISKGSSILLGISTGALVTMSMCARPDVVGKVLGKQQEDDVREGCQKITEYFKLIEQKFRKETVEGKK